MAKYAVELQNVTKTFPGGRNTAVFTAVAELNLNIEQGEFFTLLGPSGCGKTTTLRMIAGFEQPTSGSILINGRPMQDVAPNHRPVNTVFQNYALFPHLTVAQNVGFGLKVKRVPAAEREQRVQKALSLVQLPTLDSRRPGQLSGGQQQRVALARALVNEPAVLLLDEPLGALDLKLRKAMQLELKHLQVQVGITFIYVTHDQEEALTMSDRIAVMNQGIVQQIGSPHDIYDHPTNRFVADFIGETNFLEGSVVKLDEFATVVIGDMNVLGAANGRPVALGQTVSVAIRPEKINLYPQGEFNVIEDEIGFEMEELAALVGGRLPLGKIDVRKYLAAEKNSVVLEGRIIEAIYIGTNTRYRVQLSHGREIFVLTQNFGYRYDTTFDVGDLVYAHWAAENAHILTQ